MLRPRFLRRAALTATACGVAIAAIAPNAFVNATSQGVSEGTGVSGNWTARPATYGEVRQRDLAIRMADGTILRADVYLPAIDGKPAPGKFPVIVSQTPYNKNAPIDAITDHIPYLVTRGYAQVVVDVRGTGSSQGQWVALQTQEQLDGKAVADWAVNQPWSNGSSALYGISYGAITAVLTAEQQPRGLKAVFPIVPSGDPYRDVLTAGGAIDSGFIPFWLGLITGSGLVPGLSTAKDPQASLKALTDHINGAINFQGGMTVNVLTGGAQAYDNPYYRSIAALDRISSLRVPTFVVGGQHDLFQRSEPLLFNALRAQGTPTRLLFGDWFHLTASVGAGLPGGGVPSLNDLVLRWFDHYVRGVADPTLDSDIAPVTYQQLNTHQWLRAASWPPSGTQYKALQLGGQALPVALNHVGAGTLGGATGGKPDALLTVPTTGVCTLSTSQWTAGLDFGICDHANNIGDVGGLAYDLPVPAGGLNLAGPIAAHLTVSSQSPDASITVRVEDVKPSGLVRELTNGTQILSLRELDTAKSEYANGLLVHPYHPMTETSVKAMPAGQPVPVDIEIFPTGALIPAGDRLRVTITSTDLPQHLSTVPTLLSTLQNAAGGLKIWHDAAHPSYLVVPVAP